MAKSTAKVKSMEWGPGCDFTCKLRIFRRARKLVYWLVALYPLIFIYIYMYMSTDWFKGKFTGQPHTMVSCNFSL